MPPPDTTPPTKSQQQQASPRMPSTLTARLQESDPTWRAKLWLRALAAILSLASASCFCTALAIWPEPVSGRSYWRGGINLPTDALPLFPLFWSVLFAILFTAYLFARKRPLHQAFVIASDLAVWVTIGGLAFWIVLGSVFWNYVGGRDVHCVKSLNVKNQWILDIYCNPARRTKGMCELAGLWLLLATLLAHFALFVWLCREVDVRRKREQWRELEALYLQDGDEDGQGEMASNNGAEVGPRATKTRGERMAREELSW